MTQAILQQPGTTSAHLTQALLIWQTPSKVPAHASMHTVRDGVIEPAATPLTLRQLHSFNQSLQGLVSSTVAKAQNALQLLPATVLAFEPHLSTTVWWRPTSPVPQFYDCAELGKIQGVINIPSLVFCQEGNGLKVCAIKGKDRPGAQTLVYHAPLFNIHSNGAVCLGEVNLKSVHLIEDIASNETAFLRGINTHPNGDHRKTNYPTGIFALWRDLIAKPKTPWNDKWLVPMGKLTLSQWLEGNSQ